MSKASADRSRAARLRVKVERGKKLSATERAWLKSYEAGKGGGGKFAVPRPLTQDEHDAKVVRIVEAGQAEHDKMLEDAPPLVILEAAPPPVDPMAHAAPPIIVREDAPAVVGASPVPAGAAPVVAAEEKTPVAPEQNQIAAGIAGLTFGALDSLREVASAYRSAGRPVPAWMRIALDRQQGIIGYVHAAACRSSDRLGLSSVNIPYLDEATCAAAVGASVWLMVTKDELIADAKGDGSDVAPSSSTAHPAPPPPERPAPPAPPAGVFGALDG